MDKLTLSTCNLNQWAMDFAGNLARIIQSIEKAKNANSRYRLGPELETTGYACEDHFLEPDTFLHSWQCIAQLLHRGYTDDILLDIGAPVLHRDVPYNCRILIANRQILLIRPKIDLADHGNYRESRWFRSWHRSRPLEHFLLPPFLRAVCRNKTPHCPIGIAVVETTDGVTVGCETCEELWTPNSSHIALCLAGVDIIANGSASHHVLRKLDTRIHLLKSATTKGGGVYLYSNQIGCDGARLYYDGSALIALNGSILQQGSQFTVETEAEVITALVDLGDVRAYRSGIASRAVQAADAQFCSPVKRIRPDSEFYICSTQAATPYVTTETETTHYSPQQEIAKGPACWLWDYLRRSGMNGFFLPLSGGADSSSTAAIVGSMCQMLVTAAASPDVEDRLLNDIRRVTHAGPQYVPADAKQLAKRILFTAYMDSSGISSASSRTRASNVANEIGTHHVNIDITSVFQAILSLFRAVCGNVPRFSGDGGSAVENVALQNVQARVRMVVSYLFAQLSLWATGRQGSLLVLGSSNVDEGLRGYLTKYDCSAADLNPIGGISKRDLKQFLLWAASEEGLGYSALSEVVEAPPSAELEPIKNGRAQTDEEDMGMSYEELSWFGRLRKLHRCGPYSMYMKLKYVWASKFSLQDVAQKVKFFFRMYSMNRHKMTTLTPSYHAEDYSPEDNRFDLRQFLYNKSWTWQFEKIDEDASGESTNHV